MQHEYQVDAKKTMSQLLPLMLQLSENPYMLDSLKKIGYTVDINELSELDAQLRGEAECNMSR